MKDACETRLAFVLINGGIRVTVCCTPALALSAGMVGLELDQVDTLFNRQIRYDTIEK